MSNSIKDYFVYWYLQYELITCIYMFEPWEKILLHGTLMFILALISYSSYAYLPKYVSSLWDSYVYWIS